VTTKKWIWDKYQQKVVKFEDYHVPESKWIAPDWVSETPRRGHWKLRLNNDGSYQLIDLSKDSGEYDNLFVQGDYMDELEHPKTGEKVNSKQRWDAINRAHGLEIVGIRRPEDVKKFQFESPKQDILESIEKWRTPSWAEAERQKQAWEREHPDRELQKLDRKALGNL
jgi:hypothetical protein